MVYRWQVYCDVEFTTSTSSAYLMVFLWDAVGALVSKQTVSSRNKTDFVTAFHMMMSGFRLDNMKGWLV